MKASYAWMMVGACVVMAGCAGVRPVTETVAPDPEANLEAREQALEAAGGIVGTATSASLTMPMAENKALRRGRSALAEAMVARVETAQQEILDDVEVSDPLAVRAWFSGVSSYLVALIETGSTPALQQREEQEGLFSVWILMVESPATILEAMELRATNDRQLFEMLRASQAYRSLEKDAQRFKAYLTENPL